MSQGKCGKSFLLKKGVDTFAMAKVTTISMNSSLVDATTKSTNSWAEFIPACGIKSASIQLAGLFTDTDYEQQLIVDFMAGTPGTYSIIDGYGNDITGEFIIQDYELSGSFDSGEEFSMTLASSGEPTYTPSP